MKISKRLLAIAKYLDKGKVFYDCGSDHGLLPCFCVLNGYCKKAYAGDNKKGPLKKALENIKFYGLCDKVIPVLSDGLENVENDVEVVAISGMGFSSVKNIFEKSDIKRFDYLVIQINKDTNLLRDYIAKKGYKIIDEEIIFDDFYYEIIVFDPNEKLEMNSVEIEYGPINLKKRSLEFLDYLKFQINKYQKIYEKSKNNKLLLKIKEIREIIDDEKNY